MHLGNIEQQRYNAETPFMMSTSTCVSMSKVSTIYIIYGDKIVYKILITLHVQNMYSYITDVIK